MQLDWLKDFLALAEQRNFSRAADARIVSLPAFSRRIRALEDWIGTPLFVRGAQGAILTQAVPTSSRGVSCSGSQEELAVFVGPPRESVNRQLPGQDPATTRVGRNPGRTAWPHRRDQVAVDPSAWTGSPDPRVGCHYSGSRR
jgi:hypothetical protein